MSQAATPKPPDFSVVDAVSKTFERRSLWLATGLLLLMFGLALTSMSQKAPTFDEQGFIVRGLAYLRGYSQIRVGHPIGLNGLNALFLSGDESVRLPLDDPSWTGSSFHRPAELFLWEYGNDVEHIMFLARLPSIWVGLLLAAFVGRWAWQNSKRRWAGLLALLFVALDPNILAHTRLATTDLGLTAFALLSGYTLWRFLRGASWGKALLAGAAFGLLMNTKFTAGLFAPLFALLILVGLGQMWIHQHRSKGEGSGWISAFPWQVLIMLISAYPLAALLTLWAANGFNVSTMPADLPMLSVLSGKTLPLAHYLEQLLDIGGRLQVGTPSFLMGQYSDSGWWYYFPAAFFLKTPLPTLILLIWGTAAFLLCLLGLGRKGNCLSASDSAALLIPALGFFLIALTTDINLGYRHILPILPFLVIFASASIASGTRAYLPSMRMITAFLLSLWLIVISLFIYPDFLAYFNFFAGGPDNGWHSLVDSNIDWGQDLDDLPGWMEENGVDEIWLSYFGEARPEYYGIIYQGLDSFPPRLMDSQARTFAPSNPAPGIYAISATNLQGVHFSNHDLYAWFREQEPLDKLGHSIFIYQVPNNGDPASLLLSDIQMDEIRPEDYALLGSNDVTGRWIDLSESLIVPEGEDVWMARSVEQDMPEQLSSYLDDRLETAVSNEAYELARYDTPKFEDDAIAEFSLDNGRIVLQEVDVDQNDVPTITITTRWEQLGEPQPLKLFIHALDTDGQLAAQWDGLGAKWQGWHSGDTLIQLHTLTLPDDLPLESAKLQMGVYDPDTGQRWNSAEGLDQIQLQQ